MRWTLIFCTALLTSACGQTPVVGDQHDDHAEGDERDAHDDGAETVELTLEAVASARIIAEPAEQRALNKRVAVPARITLDPTREALVSTWVTGQAAGISVRPGDTIKEGQRLAAVRTPDIGEAVAAWRSAKAQDAAASARLARLQRLVEQGVTSTSQLQEASALRASASGSLEAAEERVRILSVDPTVGDPHAGEHYPSEVPVRSPIGGKVLRVAVSAGQQVEPGQTLFHIGDLDEVWLMLDVYERDLAAVSVGQSVQFSVEAWPSQVFEGTVAQLGDWLNPATRTVEVRVVVSNPDHRLKPNMFAQAVVQVTSPNAESGVVLPLVAVQRMGSTDIVFIEVEPGHYAVRPVVVAERTVDEIRLSSGVAPGEHVVVDGAFALKSELEKSELGEGHAH